MKLHLTVEEVLQSVFSGEEEAERPEEPIMDGSDDEFSDIEWDEYVSHSIELSLYHTLQRLHTIPQPHLHLGTCSIIIHTNREIYIYIQVIEM